MQPGQYVLMRTISHTQTNTHTNTNTHIHIHAQHTCTLIHTHVCTYVDTHTHNIRNICTYIICIQNATSTKSHQMMSSETTKIDTEKLTGSDGHGEFLCTYVHTHTHMQTHTHTHTYVCVFILFALCMEFIHHFNEIRTSL